MCANEGFAVLDMFRNYNRTESMCGLSTSLLPIIGCLEISFPSSFLVLCFIDARSTSLVSSFNPLKIQAPIKQRAIMDEGKLSNRGPDMAEAREGKVISFAPSTSSTIRGTRYCSTLWEQTAGSQPSISPAQTTTTSATAIYCSVAV